MAQIFPRSANYWVKASLGVAAALPVLALATIYAIASSGYMTRENEVRAQPVPFSHNHHANTLNIDCRYCHTSVEEAASAGMPSTHTCMTCHSQIWNESPMLQAVRDSYRDNEPIEWTRVHDLPDYAYFNHSIHVAKGIGCSSCHGPIDEMPLVYQDASLYMGWCLDCHRAPEEHIRPRSEIFNMSYQHPENQAELAAQLIEEYQVQTREDCYACHR